MVLHLVAMSEACNQVVSNATDLNIYYDGEGTELAGMVSGTVGIPQHNLHYDEW